MTTPDNPYGDPGQNQPPPPAGLRLPAVRDPAACVRIAAVRRAGTAVRRPRPYGAPPAGNFGGTLVEWPIRVASALIDAHPGVHPVDHRHGLRLDRRLLAADACSRSAFWIWNMLRQGKTGQSIGKSAMGTYLVREADGQYIGGGLSIGRSLLHILDVIPCFVGLLWPLWDAKKQTFADKIVGTVVVKR